MQAGLLRSYTSVVNEDRLNLLESKEWRDLVWTTCFMHSVVQERRKFGSVGWCIPYEFNLSDLEASLTFLAKHCEDNQNSVSWQTIQYMVCQVQYGGRITNDLDRDLFLTFGARWLTPRIREPDFEFAPARGKFRYVVPDKCEKIADYHAYIASFPEDTPELFGLHPNAELNYGTTEAKHMFDTISDTQPKDVQATKGVVRTREDIVKDEADRQLQRIKGLGYVEDVVKDKIRNKRPKGELEKYLAHPPEEKDDGFSLPLNVFLFQEVMRLNASITKVRSQLLSVSILSPLACRFATRSSR